MLTVHISDDANDDIEKIIRYGKLHHGKAGTAAYKKLIDQAIKDVAIDPKRNGSKPVYDHPRDLRKYPIDLSKTRAGVKFKKPSDSVFYFTIKDEILIVSAVTSPKRVRHINEIDVDAHRREAEAEKGKSERHVIDFDDPDRGKDYKNKQGFYILKLSAAERDYKILLYNFQSHILPAPLS